MVSLVSLIVDGYWKMVVVIVSAPVVANKLRDKVSFKRFVKVESLELRTILKLSELLLLELL